MEFHDRRSRSGIKLNTLRAVDTFPFPHLAYADKRALATGIVMSVPNLIESAWREGMLWGGREWNSEVAERRTGRKTNLSGGIEEERRREYVERQSWWSWRHERRVRRDVQAKTEGGKGREEKRWRDEWRS